MSPSVFVIGTIFIDCKGFANNSYHPSTRNLGSIRFVHGGVGRNVAENLANLNVPTFLVSSVDTSAMGREVVDRLQKSKVKTDYLIASNDRGMGMWLAILDENGDLVGSVSQMPDLLLLQKNMITRGAEIFQQGTHLVLEMDLNIVIARSVIAAARYLSIPLYGIPGNLEVVLKNRDILDHLDCFICNNFEADLLIGKNFSNMDIDQKQKALIQFVDQTALQSMVITLGEEGSVYYDSGTKEAGYQPVFPVKMVDSSGAGDAFFSGTVMGLVRGLSLKEAVICGTKVAGWTIESKENICPDLSLKILLDEFFKNISKRSKT
jgi:pseudouridine kinase